MADRLGVESVDREGRTVVLKFRPQARLDPVRLVALVRQRPDLTLIPPAGLKLTLDQGSGVRDSGSGKKAVPSPGPQFLFPGPRKGGSKVPVAPPSWWTARARAGEVKFTKARF
jgi:hypothetical protein